MATEPVSIILEASNIYVPLDVRGSEKTPLYSYDSTSEPANKTIVLPPFDFVNCKTFSGIISANPGLTMYIQESHEQSEWLTMHQMAIGSSTTKNIGGTSYYSAVPFQWEPSLRYARLLLVLGTSVTAQLSIRLYRSSL